MVGTVPHSARRLVHGLVRPYRREIVPAPADVEGDDLHAIDLETRHFFAAEVLLEERRRLVLIAAFEMGVVILPAHAIFLHVSLRVSGVRRGTPTRRSHPTITPTAARPPAGACAA